MKYNAQNHSWSWFWSWVCRVRLAGSGLKSAEDWPYMKYYFKSYCYGEDLGIVPSVVFAFWDCIFLHDNTSF